MRWFCHYCRRLVSSSIVVAAILATSAEVRPADESWPASRELLRSVLHNQSSKVVYIEEPSNTNPYYPERMRFLPVSVVHGSDTSGARLKTFILTSGLLSKRSLFYYWVPTFEDSGFSAINVAGGERKFFTTGAPWAPTAETASRVDSQLAHYGRNIILYDSLRIVDGDYHDHVYYRYSLGIAGCAVGGVAGLQDDKDLSRVGGYAAVGLGGFLVYKLIDAVRDHAHRQSIERDIRQELKAAAGVKDVTGSELE